MWRILQTPGDEGHTTIMQWVPGHAGVDGNEAADCLVGEAAVENQETTPIDLASARGAIRRYAMEMARKIAEESHRFTSPTPGHDSLPRWEAVTVSQLRTGGLL